MDDDHRHRDRSLILAFGFEDLNSRGSRERGKSGCDMEREQGSAHEMWEETKDDVLEVEVEC